MNTRLLLFLPLILITVSLAILFFKHIHDSTSKIQIKFNTKRTRRYFHIGLPAGITGVLLWTQYIPRPWDPFLVVVSVIVWIVETLSSLLLNVLSTIFIVGVEPFLFYDNPRNIGYLNEVWMYSVILFGFIIVSMMGFMWVTTMLFSNDDKANFHRLVKRILIATILVIISRDVYAIFAKLTNDIARAIYPESYNFENGIRHVEAIASQAPSIVAETFAQTFVSFAITLVAGGTLLVSGLLIIIILLFRVLIIYTIYAILPVVLGFWAIDVGPLKYGKFLPSFSFKISSFMMLYGIIFAGILASGSAAGGDIGSGIGRIAFDSAVIEPQDNIAIIGTGDYGPTGMDMGPNQLSIQEAVTPYFIYVGALWASIGITLSLFGLVLSAGAASSGGAGGFGGITRGSQESTHTAQSSGNTEGQTGPGQRIMYENEDGGVTMVAPNGGGIRTTPSGEKEQFSPEEGPFSGGTIPDPVAEKLEQQTPDGPPLSEKADHALGGIPSSTIDTAGKATERAADRAEEIAQSESRPEPIDQTQYASKIGVEAQNRATDLANKFTGSENATALGQRAGDIAAGTTYGAIGAGNYARQALAKTGNMARQIPHSAFKAGNYMKRAGGAYGQIYRQPKSERIAETKRIMRESSAFNKSIAEQKQKSTHQQTSQTLEDLKESGIHTANSVSGGPSYKGAIRDPSPESLSEVITTEQAKQAPLDFSNVSDSQLKTALEDLQEEFDLRGIDAGSLPTDTKFVNALEDRMESIVAGDDTIYNDAFLRQDNIQAMLNHYNKSIVNVSPERALEAVMETGTTAHLEQIGLYETSPATRRAAGVELIPEQLQTRDAIRCVNMGMTGEAGDRGFNMRRYEFADDRDPVYMQVANDEQVGASALTAEEATRKLRGEAHKQHYDPVSRTLRSEKAGDATIRETALGDGPVDPDEIDRDEVVDTYATAYLTGNKDAHNENIVVTEDGDVNAIDLEHTGYDPTHQDIEETIYAKEARKASEAIGFEDEITEEEVAERAQNLAENADFDNEEMKTTIKNRTRRSTDNLETVDDIAETEDIPSAPNNSAESPSEKITSRQVELDKQIEEKVDNIAARIEKARNS